MQESGRKAALLHGTVPPVTSGASHDNWCCHNSLTGGEFYLGARAVVRARA